MCHSTEQMPVEVCLCVRYKSRVFSVIKWKSLILGTDIWSSDRHFTLQELFQLDLIYGLAGHAMSIQPFRNLTSTSFFELETGISVVVVVKAKQSVKKLVNRG